MRISEAKSCIKELYKNTSEVTTLISERGVGKTSAYKQCAEELGIGYIALYAAALEGPDFTGLPDKSNDSGITRYLAPQFLPTQKAIDEGLFPEKGLLVFEEINRVPGGELRIEKKLFIREMLRPDSVMKHLLNYNLEDHGKTRSLKIDKSDANQVVINFNFVDKVGVGEDYQALLENLKKDLQGRIQGSVTLTIDAYYEAMYLTIDFNSDDGHISQNF